MAAALLLGGCADHDGEGPATVSGQVVSETTRQPVPRPPQVQLWQRAQSAGSLTGGAAYAPLGAPHATDAQGRFAFSFEAEARREYVLRAAGGLGYYTDWARAPALRGGQQNTGVQVPAAAPAWIRLDLVDELPRNRVWMFFSGFGGGGLQLPFPRDTSVVFPYLAGQENFIYWRITNAQGQETTGQRTFTQAPLDTQRVRIAF
ncbi:hypothetical protein [Hymenobacter siberiensis]|jgi:hypothetical protein|nr:hypothetical protein [Hymenobacter siberiensis]MBU6119581.1 hypothetical protein [Hymenobacter siberiensis]